MNFKNPLPAGWRMARVGEILKVRNGYAFKSMDYKSEGTPLIRQSDLAGDLVEIAEAKRVDPRFLKELPGFVVREGDLLIGMSGSLGKIARYQHAEPALQNQRTGLLQVKLDHEPKFAKLVLKYVEPQILAEGKGIAVQNVSATEIEDCEFPLPPLAEQRRIVAEVEKQFTRLDAGVAALKRVQANLKRYRAAVLKAACEGKLVPTEAELHKQSGSGKMPLASKTKEKRQAAASTFETGEQLLKRILAERRKNWSGRGKYTEPVAPDTPSLPPLPEGWAWASLDQLLLSLRNGISAKPDADLGLPILRISAVRPLSVNLADVRYLDANIDDHSAFSLDAGDILFTRYNGNPDLVGVCGVVPPIAAPVVHPDKLIRCKVVPSGLLPTFVAIMANVGASRDFLAKRVRTTAGQAGISGADLKALPVPFAPLREQTRIVSEVERRLSVVEELEVAVETNLRRATRLRQAILHQAFTTEL